MEYIVDGDSMKRLDSFTMNEIGVPSMVLMEQAAMAVTSVLLGKISKKDSIIVLVGPGNNGADGVAVARLLALRGYAVDVYIIGDQSRFTGQLKEQLSIAQKIGVKCINNAKMSEYNVVVDAIFGIGLSKPIRGEAEAVIRSVNDGDFLVVSVDIPSGICSRSGKVLGTAIKADITVTFGYKKIGMLLYPGCEYTGELITADIGFPSLRFAEITPTGVIYQKEDLAKLPKRINWSNKGTYGKVLVIAGSKNMSGACYLSAKAAYRMGAGLVKVLTAEENRVILQTMLPEAIISTYDASTIEKEIAWATTVVFGPGIGVTDTGRELLQAVLTYSKVPTVIDADGLNLLAERGSLDTMELPDNLILTPHLMEMGRICHTTVEQVKEHLVEIAKETTKHTGYVLVLKDARTVVTSKNQLYLNTSGNNGMSTGGSGDVLSGIIAGLLASGMSNYEAACLGVYIHGLAGDMAKQEVGEYSLMATNLIECISKILCVIK